jgi:hypothetical protein
MTYWRRQKSLSRAAEVEVVTVSRESPNEDAAMLLDVWSGDGVASQIYITSILRRL